MAKTIMEYNKVKERSTQITSAHAQDVFEELARARENAQRDSAKFLNDVD